MDVEFPEAMFSPNKPAISYGECFCGCGGKTNLVQSNRTDRGNVKGTPYKFIRGHHSRILLPAFIVHESGCWIWRGVSNGDGYGCIMRGNKTYLVHRVFYEHLIGPIPSGRQIDHLCRNRKCVYPRHLEAVTQQENIRRGETGINMRSKTHCPQGHEYNETNTMHTKNGQRRCRPCLRMHARKYYWQNPEKFRELTREYRRRLNRETN